MSVQKVLFALTLTTFVLSAQSDWPDPGRDKTAQRYSPLDQINVSNVRNLSPAWSADLKKEGRLTESVPVVVGGVMYVSWPNCHVAALDPESGQELWRYTATPCDFRGNGLSSMRSVAYWPGDKQREARILFATEEGYLYALSAKTGRPVPGFAKEGVLNLKTPEIMNGFPNMHYGITSAPLVFENLVITGSHIVDETGSKGPAGDVRAWDARDGKLVWTFHTVPRPGEKGHETWLGDTWKNQSGGNVWTFFTADTERATLFMGLGSMNNDYYGVDRPGPNLFGNSLVAVDIRTGKLKWYFQAIHHDLWDYDMPAAPMLFDVVQNGKKIPAVAAITKNPLLFILDRTTGKPIYGAEEKPVPAGDLPGEWYSPTQPFPVKPPPLSRQSFSENDFAKITPEHEAACREWYANFLKRGGVPNKGPYTPASANGSLRFPTQAGGAWLWGGAFDPKLGYYIINTTDSGGLAFIRPDSSIPSAAYGDPDGASPILYSRGTNPGGGRGAPTGRGAGGPPAGGGASAVSFSADGMPCWAPPWGRLTAVNVNTGDIAWQIPFGTTPGTPPGMNTGGVNSQGGPTTTGGGLTFIGGSRDAYIRAFETRTGTELWSFHLNDVATDVPITYLGKSGKQYVAIVAGDKLVTFALGSGAPSASIQH